MLLRRVKSGQDTIYSIYFELQIRAVGTRPGKGQNRGAVQVYRLQESENWIQVDDLFT